MHDNEKNNALTTGKDYKSLLQELKSIVSKGLSAAYKAVDNLKVWPFPIVNMLCSQLSWSHFRYLSKVEDEKENRQIRVKSYDPEKRHWSLLIPLSFRGKISKKPNLLCE